MIGVLSPGMGHELENGVLWPMIEVLRLGQASCRPFRRIVSSKGKSRLRRRLPIMFFDNSQRGQQVTLSPFSNLTASPSTCVSYYFFLLRRIARYVYEVTGQSGRGILCKICIATGQLCEYYMQSDIPSATIRIHPFSSYGVDTSGIRRIYSVFKGFAHRFRLANDFWHGSCPSNRARRLLSSPPYSPDSKQALVQKA